MNAADAGRLAELAAEYDAAPRTQSFADWMRAGGHGALLELFIAALEAQGDTATLALIAETPETFGGEPAQPLLTPEESWARFDAPTSPGPWALGANGRWFKASTMAQGGKVESYDGREIYVPPQKPGTEAAPTNYSGRGMREQKFRAAMAATLRGNFYELFFDVAPRGSKGPVGLSAGGTDSPYQDYYAGGSEGGNLYPGLSPGAEADALYDWWRYPKNLAPDHPIMLRWLRAYAGADGFFHFKPFTESELRDWVYNWYLSRHAWACGSDQLKNEFNRLWGIQQQQTRKYGPEFFDPRSVVAVYPLSQCAEKSSVRRRKNIKKAVAIGGVVTAGIFFGPAIFKALKTVAVKVGGAVKTGIGKIAGAIGDVVTAGATAGVTARVAGAEAQTAAEISEAQRQVLEIVSDPATQAAIEAGELPAPPASTQDPAWLDWVVSIGTGLLQREMAQDRQELADETARARAEQSDALELMRYQAELEREAERLRRETIALGYGQTTPEDSADRIMQAGAAGGMSPAVLAGLGLLGLVMLNR